MPTAITRKGQVTIPKAIRDRLGLEPGNAIDFDLAEDGRVVLFKVGDEMPTSRFERLRGSAGPGLSTNEIMALLRGEPG